MNEQGVKEAGKEQVKETLRLLDGKRHEVTFRKLEDPARHKRLFVDSKIDLEAYYALPRPVKRWALPQSKLAILLEGGNIM